MATFKELMSAIISKLNCKVASVNGTTPDENGNVEVQSGVQSDWHMNNETNPAFVKNRPFYTGEPSFTEIIPEQTYTLALQGRYAMYVDQSGTYPYSLEPDKEYTVVYNGTTYELTSSNIEGLGGVGDVNPVLTGSEPTMPFVIGAGKGILQIIDYTGNTEVTFKISGYNTEIKQIDVKYIPELPKYMTKENPVGYGSFSLNRKAGTTVGPNSHAEGYHTEASGTYSHAEGRNTVASSDYQHVQGKYNIEDSAGVYAHIVGNGTESKSSNCHTIDWNGNAWFSGTIEGTSIIIPSSTAGSTKKFKITVDDSGTISATEVT